MDFVLRGSGGLGRLICFSGVVRQFKHENQSANVHVMASYPEIFSGLSFVDRFYPFPAPGVVMPDFFENHKGFDVLEAEPYLDLKYRQGKEHLIDVWCRKLGLKAPSEKRGVIILNSQEKQWAKKIVHNMGVPSGKLVAFQPFGGTSYYQADQALDPSRQKSCRDLSSVKAQEIVNELNKAGFVPLQISLPTETRLANCLQLPVQAGQIMSPRFIFALLDLCDGLVAIDSFAQHAWAALGKASAVVLWGATNPINLGYSANKNMALKGSCENLHCNRPETHLYDVQGDGKFWNCPFSANCMEFDPKKVVENLVSSFGEKK